MAFDSWKHSFVCSSVESSFSQSKTEPQKKTTTLKAAAALFMLQSLKLITSASLSVVEPCEIRCHAHRAMFLQQILWITPRELLWVREPWKVESSSWIWERWRKFKESHLVLRNGIRMPAAVAVSSSTTWRIVKTTLINFTTKARAFELSIPSTVNCCWDKCSIFWICAREKSR